MAAPGARDNAGDAAGGGNAERGGGAPGASRVTAIVLARAGSKGVPGKNRAMVAGKPCAQWTLEQALAARLVQRVALSTDDHELSALARGMGVEVIERPADLAHDRATVDDALRHAASALDAEHQTHGAGGTGAAQGRERDEDAFVLLYANVPVRPTGLIDEAVALLRDTGCDSVQSFTGVGKHHPWWTVRVDEDGRLRPWEGNTLFHGVFRRQDLPPAHVPDGAVTAVTRRALFLRVAGVAPGPHAFLGVDRRAVLTPEGSVVDIDEPTDLLVADAKLRAMIGAGATRGAHTA
jgi:N-acylneuraminate cytidylyltransferase